MLLVFIFLFVMGIRNVIFAPDEFYHIYSRGVEKRLIFLDDRDRNRFVALLYVANNVSPVHLSNYQNSSFLEIPKDEPLVSIGAWCLMPNHFHILIKEIKKGGTSIFMKKLLTGYSMYFNTKYERKGTLFDGAFKAKYLDTDNYLKYQYSYIHLNPIGIIDSGWKIKKLKDKSAAKKFLKTYPYSSYFDYLGNDREWSVIINKKDFPDYFSIPSEVSSMIDDWLNFENFQNIKVSP